MAVSDEWTEDFRERWRHLDPAYPDVCGIRNDAETDVCILPLDHAEPHGWENHHWPAVLP